MSTVSAHVPDHVREAAEKEADRAGMSLSEWLRFQLRKVTDTEPPSLDEMSEGEKVAAA
jgi:antitoxin component of RelBE/YafQ-DinJ toxin-antitoxin module